MHLIKKPLFLPIVAGLLVGLIWGSWLPVTRFSLLNSLNVSDIIFIRFTTAAIITLPFLFKFGFVVKAPYALAKTLILALGSGILYVSTASSGFIFLPASYGSIIPISMLFFSIIMGVILYQKGKADIKTIISLSLIMIGFFFFVEEINKDVSLKSGVFEGVSLFVLAGFFFACYNVSAKKWQVNPVHAVSLVSFYSCLIFSPIYFFISQKKIFTVSFNELLLQTAYHGIVISLLSLVLFSYCAAQLGSSRASLFNVLVPINGVLLSVIFLDEKVSLITLFCLLLMLIGMTIGLLKKKTT